MVLKWHRFVPARLRKSAAAVVGGSAAVALVVAALVSTGTPDTEQLFARRGSGGGAEPTLAQPTEPQMRLGATTISPTEEMPAMPGPTPPIEFAAPRIKAGH
jgi:hypothetical protein